MSELENIKKIAESQYRILKEKMDTDFPDWEESKEAKHIRKTLWKTAKKCAKNKLLGKNVKYMGASV